MSNSVEDPEWYEKYIKVGREKPILGQFPSTGIIAINQLQTGASWLCSGALIDEDYVIFGADCLYKNGWDVSNLKIKVGLGKTSFGDQRGQWIEADAYKAHTNFDFPYNNVAMVHLKTTPVLSTDANPICFPNKSSHNRYQYFQYFHKTPYYMAHHMGHMSCDI